MPGGGYGYKSGTSMAAPHVSGVAALIWSYFPNKTAQEIRQVLEASAEDLGPRGRDNDFGYGLVRADLAYNFLNGFRGELLPDMQVFSQNRKYRLKFQLDGNLVLYDQANRPLWASNTRGIQPGKAVMQRDGNFVVYDNAGRARFATGTHGRPGSYLRVENDGNLVIYSRGGTPIYDRYNGKLY